MANIAGSHATKFLHGAQMLFLFFSFLALVDLNLIFEKMGLFQTWFFQKSSADQQGDSILSAKYWSEIENMH